MSRNVLGNGCSSQGNNHPRAVLCAEWVPGAEQMEVSVLLPNKGRCSSCAETALPCLGEQEQLLPVSSLAWAGLALEGGLSSD